MTSTPPLRRPPAPLRAVRPTRPLRPVPLPVFIAPPALAEFVDEPRGHEPRRPEARPVPLTKSAQAAATRAGLSNDAVRLVLCDATTVSPDRDHPDRLRFTRGNVVAVCSRDGVVLGIYPR